MSDEQKTEEDYKPPITVKTVQKLLWVLMMLSDARTTLKKPSWRKPEPAKHIPIKPGGILQHIVWWEPELAQLLGIKLPKEEEAGQAETTPTDNEPF